MPALRNKAHFAQPGHLALVVGWMAGLDPLKRTPGLDARRVGKASSHQQLARWAHLGQQGPALGAQRGGGAGECTSWVEAWLPLCHGSCQAHPHSQQPWDQGPYLQSGREAGLRT